MAKNTNEVPKTIEQLKQWYISHNLPDEETTRFFIGKNYKGPKAFGIYKDKKNNNYIVYKNKSDGTRFIRYNGKDESYAVNELYLKLKHQYFPSSQSAKNSETESKEKKLSKTHIKRKKTNVNIPKSSSVESSNLENSEKKADNKTKLDKSENKSKRFLLILSVCLVEILIFLTIIFILVSQPQDGYYLYNNNYYYYQNWSWYILEKDTDSWEKCSSTPKDLKKHSSNYIVYDYINTNNNRFENSRYYKNSILRSPSNVKKDSDDDIDDAL